jgi:hypothetical protein
MGKGEANGRTDAPSFCEIFLAIRKRNVYKVRKSAAAQSFSSLSHNSIKVMEKSVNYCWSCKMRVVVAPQEDKEACGKRKSFCSPQEEEKACSVVVHAVTNWNL